MKKPTISLPEELQRDLTELAHRRKTTVTELVRWAVEKCYQDDLDGLLMEREIAAHGADPASSVSLEDYLVHRNNALHH